MKNIVYRPWDDRFMGRKMIKGQTIEVYGKTFKETQAKLRLALKQTKVITPSLNKKQSITLKQWWQKWFNQEKKPALKEASLKDLKSLGEKLKPIYDTPLDKLSKDIIIDFFDKLEHNRAKEKLFLYLKACLNSAVNNDILINSPFKTIKPIKKMKKRKPAFTYEQQVKLLKELPKSTLYPVIMVYLCTGLRKNEFDFKHIEKHIDFENYVIKAENLKGRDIEKRYKNIIVTKELCDFIIKHIKTIHTYDSERAYREFSLFLKSIGIEGSIVTCRHTYATNNFYLGNPELFISRNMGHATSQITKDNYTDIDYHLSKEKIINLYNKLYYQF